MVTMGNPVGGSKYKTKEMRAAEHRIKFEQDTYRRLHALETRSDELDRRLNGLKTPVADSEYRDYAFERHDA